MPASHAIDTDLARLEAGLSRLFRHDTLQRLHEVVAGAAAVDCERAIYLVLRRIARGGPTRVTDLARDLGVDPSTVSRHLQGLEARGWVHRLPDPSDGRAALVEATDPGTEAVARIEAQRRSLLEEVLDGWEADEREALARLTERFAADLTARVETKSL